MYDESDYIMLSVLQHCQFCPRQCALIHKNSNGPKVVIRQRGRSRSLLAGVWIKKELSCHHVAKIVMALLASGIFY